MTDQEIDDLPMPVRQPRLRASDHRGCRYIADDPIPLWPGLFCGAPTVPGSAYCAAHRKVCYGWRPSRKGGIGALCEPRDHPAPGETGHAKA